MKRGFWTTQPGTGKKYEPGILPDKYEPGIYVGVLEEPPDEDFLEEVEGTLKRGCRKRWVKAMNQVKIGEVYSEPRVTKEAESQGLPLAGAYDLKNGYNLTKVSDTGRDASRNPRSKTQMFWWYLRLVVGHSAFCKNGTIARCP